MKTDLPQPMTPSDCDLQDFEFMPVMVRRLLKSDTWSLGTGDERAAAVALWFESWHQVPAASLPSDDRLLRRLADAEKWSRVKAQALRGWVLCSDGRIYHPVVAEKALEAWIEKLVNSISGAIGNAKRWQVPIDTKADVQRLRAAVDMLRAIDPNTKALRKKSVLNILAGSPPESPPDLGAGSPPDYPPESPPDAQSGSPPDSPGDRKGQGQGQGQGLNGSLNLGLLPETDAVGGAALRAPAPPSPPPRFRGTNGPDIPDRAIVPLADDWQLPERWGEDAEALGFKPAEILHEAEKFRQYFVAGKGAGTRRGVKGWRQSWSNWLGKAAATTRRAP